MEFKKIGFIGLGAMGLPMAKNLLKNGFELYIKAHHNREPIEELIKAGAKEETSLADIVSRSELLISILPADQEMESVLLSSEVLNQLTTDKVLVEMTSGSPEMMKKINSAYQNKGVGVLDAPVSGGTIGAENGTLTIMVGGDKALLEKCHPVLEAMAENIYLVGKIGAGKAIKAINQMLAGIHMLASAEAVALAEKLEIDKDILKQVVGKSSGASWMLLNKIDTLAKRDFEPGFKLELMKKDIQIAVEESTDKLLPLVSFVLERYKQAAKEDGELDFSAISKEILS
ncbi:NAD(P)-dependent oxidoreductase [Niallia sp. JL1B1071]|uniref:NAD(P)-dependent oxidoreductase n=1 Tax=Niallia tiangongensis TaxID=3237105 RepID=UPI0037DCC6C7